MDESAGGSGADLSALHRQLRAQFWIGDSLLVYGHNLNNEIQPIGPLSSLVEYAIDLAFEELNWYEQINVSERLAKYGLQPINAMD